MNRSNAVRYWAILDEAVRGETALLPTVGTPEEIAASVGADTLGCISLEGMIEATAQTADRLCTACFTGQYPVELPDGAYEADCRYPVEWFALDEQANKDLAALCRALEVEIDQVARIMINQESGTIVISQEVRVSPVAIAQGSITVKVTEAQQVSQPGALATAGETKVVDRTQVEVNETGTGKVAMFNRGASLQDIVDGLNSLGISPRDLISIIQALKASGALRAELIMM